MENTTPHAFKAGSFMAQVHDGMHGKNVGLHNGLNKINDYLYGTHKGRYYLIGADSGVGKTTLTDHMYVISAWKSARANSRKFKLFYFSFEISSVDKYARWASYFIFLNSGERLPSDYILGRVAGHNLSKEHLEKVKEAYIEIEEMLKDVVIIDHTLTPSQIYHAVVDFYALHGLVSRDSVSEKDKKAGKLGDVLGYRAGDEIKNAAVFLVCDHIALADQDPGTTQKTMMDSLSKYAVKLKNTFGTTIIFIQQFATELLAANRQAQLKKTVMALMPSRLDFGDSKAPFRDADTVMGLIQPGRDLSAFPGGWSLDRDGGLGLYCIMAVIIKNRYGTPLRNVPIFLDGVTGFAEDLPMPEIIKNGVDPVIRDQFYKKAREIDQVCQIFSPQKK